MILLVIAPNREMGVTLGRSRGSQMGTVTRVPEEWNWDTLIMKLATPSLLPEPSVLLHTDDAIWKGDPPVADRLVEMIQGKKIHHHLILVVSKKAKHPLYDTLKKKEGGEVVDLTPSKPWEAGRSMEQLLTTLLSQAGIEMERRAERELLDRIGENPGRLKQEVNKLLSFAKGERVTLEDVKALVADERIEEFGLQNALRKRNPSALAVHLRQAIARGGSPQALFAQIINEIRRLFILSHLVGRGEKNLSRDAFIKRIYPDMKKRGGKVGEMDTVLGRNWSKPYYLYHLYAALAHYSTGDLARILEGLGDLHAASRQGLVPEDLLTGTLTLIGEDPERRGRAIYTGG